MGIFSYFENWFGSCNIISRNWFRWNAALNILSSVTVFSWIYTPKSFPSSILGVRSCTHIFTKSHFRISSQITGFTFSKMSSNFWLLFLASHASLTPWFPGRLLHTHSIFTTWKWDLPVHCGYWWVEQGHRFRSEWIWVRLWMFRIGSFKKLTGSNNIFEGKYATKYSASLVTQRD